MSIRDQINSLVQDGRLFELYPVLKSEKVSRCMFVSKQIWDEISPQSDEKFDERFAKLRADLDRFVDGSEVTVAHNPYKRSKKAYIARTNPIEDEVWDIRSVDPRPGIRVLGFFAEKDVFIALEWEFRTNLDGPGGKLWSKFLRANGAHWRRLFGVYRPHSGGQTSDYISENHVDV